MAVTPLLDPPPEGYKEERTLTPAVFQAHWEKTAEKMGVTAVRQQHSSYPDAPTTQPLGPGDGAVVAWGRGGGDLDLPLTLGVARVPLFAQSHLDKLLQEARMKKKKEPRYSWDSEL